MSIRQRILVFIVIGLIFGGGAVWLRLHPRNTTISEVQAVEIAKREFERLGWKDHLQEVCVFKESDDGWMFDIPRPGAPGVFIWRSGFVNLYPRGE
jgi:hypothetical protein